ncbi:DEAD/DEAH box helicase [Tuberibacillus sp. Marseille-P3662]|uniref:DEAD/DEAH box helicase n=1 Tax=Tuberibacillus sp. Marseille-P3662 TaxID=1965358 RepID=UPI000A1CDD4D|nr:DEAD/DEAH box helicase [Tuberibacillus sp. Marseille-P3662]
MTDTWSIMVTMKPFLQSAWASSGFQTPTTIQEKVAPLVLEGHDIIGESPTGTGKTVAYLLPLLQQVDPDKKAVQVIVLAPSRELVMQIFDVVQQWTKGSDIHGAALIGGANIKRQQEKLKKHPKIVVGTPGRIHELIKLKKLKMHEVRTMVLDEGDQLLVPEHMDTIRSISKTTLKDRQTLVFSATLPQSTEEKAKELMHEPELIRIQRDDKLPSKVDHIYFVCDDPRDKIDVLRKLVKAEPLKALTFVKDLGDISMIAAKLEYKGVPLGVLNSDSTKQDREAAIKQFRAGEYPLLLATDVAARGLDIKDLTHVIHFNLPKHADQYTHRSGRTGRAGESGTVISIVTKKEERDLKRMSRELGITVHKKILFKGQIEDEKMKNKPHK